MLNISVKHNTGDIVYTRYQANVVKTKILGFHINEDGHNEETKPTVLLKCSNVGSNDPREPFFYINQNVVFSDEAEAIKFFATNGGFVYRPKKDIDVEDAKFSVVDLATEPTPETTEENKDK